MLRMAVIVLLAVLTGCQSTERRFAYGRDDVFDAAVASVRASDRMHLTSSDRAAGTFRGIVVDGFGSIYLRGKVRPAKDAKDTETIVTVDCWERSFATLILFTADRPAAEGEFLDRVAGQVRSGKHRSGSVKPGKRDGAA